MTKRDTLDSMVNSKLYHSLLKVVPLSTRSMLLMTMSERTPAHQLLFHYNQIKSSRIQLPDNGTQISFTENSVEMTTNSP
jgi:hypothetical protein